MVPARLALALGLLLCPLASSCWLRHPSSSRPRAEGGRLTLAIAKGQGGPRFGATLTEERVLNLSAGLNIVRVPGVPRDIRLASIAFRSFTDPAGTILFEQALAYDLAGGSRDDRRELYGEVVTVTKVTELWKRLVAFNPTALSPGQGTPLPQSLLPLGGALLSVVAPETGSAVGAHGEDTASGWSVVPTLMWLIKARNPGPHRVELRYELGSIDWRVDHLVFIDGQNADLTSSMTVDNHSGRPLRNVDVELDSGPGAPTALGATTLPDGEERTFPLGEPKKGLSARLEVRTEGAAGVPLAERDEEVGFGGPTEGPVIRRIVLAGAGALPSGWLHVYQKAFSGSEVALVAIRRCEGTSSASELVLDLGAAPGLSASRRRTSYRNDATRGGWLAEGYEIRVKNIGTEAAAVSVVENLVRGPAWRIRSETQPHRVLGQRTVEFPVTVAPGSEAVVGYEVAYTW